MINTTFMARCFRCQLYLIHTLIKPSPKLEGRYRNLPGPILYITTCFLGLTALSIVDNLRERT
ncbi:hypothetical protein BDV29DRAFT_165614 [Aspergillus leporis]|uniref:Uncharacterized protein n=1 Tax=Aspergillus leporis TaxID=41062 RepID=A0A5N5XE35_9EURO|nr:hypothetical protein BDV29DRAFT_165614 [Aspergillus leporis]